MADSRGFASLSIIIGAFFLIGLLQVVTINLGKNLASEEEHLRECQLHLLGISAVKKFSAEKLPAGREELCTVDLYPGKSKARVVRNVIYSDDHCFRYFDVNVLNGQLHYRLRQTRFQLNPYMYEQGQKYMFVCKGNLRGAEYLSLGKDIYTASEEVIFPEIDFLKRSPDKYPSKDVLDVAEACQEGLVKTFYYIGNLSRMFLFDPYSRIHGTAVIAADKGIKIADNCKFFDRVIFLCKGKCVIQDNVEMSHALIIASGSVNIGSGCKISGVIFSGRDINILGNSVFFHDESVLQPFSSIFSLL